MLQGITEEDKQQAEQTKQKTIHLSIRGRRCGNATESQQLKKARDYLGSAKEHSYGPIVDRYLEDEQYQMRTHKQGYMQSDMEESDSNGKGKLRGYS